MTRNEMQGKDWLNNMLWSARRLQLPVNTVLWESTGLNHAGFVIHVDFRAALQWNLIQYPETDSIQAILNDEFRFAIPSNSAATTILDAIVKELLPDDIH